MASNSDSKPLTPNVTSIRRGPLIPNNKLKEIISLAESSLLKICIESKNSRIAGSAFLGETFEHQKLLITAKHFFHSVDSKSLNLFCSNPAEYPIFNINLDEIDQEKLFFFDDPDSAAIILNNEIIKKCHRLEDRHL